MTMLFCVTSEEANLLTINSCLHSEHPVENGPVAMRAKYLVVLSLLSSHHLRSNLLKDMMLLM